MAGTSLADQMASLNATLQAIEVRFGRGEVPPESLAGFKSSVDDFRLRVWGLLTSGHGEESLAFQERFRIRRAKEMCRSLGTDLREGVVSGRHRELPELGQAAAELARGVEEARRAAIQGDE